MANSFLKKIILEEIRNILNEDTNFPGRTNTIDETPPAERTQAAIDTRNKAYQPQGKLPSGRINLDTPTARAVDTARRVTDLNAPDATSVSLGIGRKQAPDPYATGMKAINAAQANTPVGKLQAMLAQKGYKISLKPDNAPDGVVGELTLKALKAETGKMYSKDYINKNAGALVASLTPAGRKSAVQKEVDKSTAPIEKAAQPNPSAPMFNVDPTKAAPPSKSPLDGEDLTKPFEGHSRPSVDPENPKQESLAFIRNQFSKHLKNL